MSITEWAQNRLHRSGKLTAASYTTKRRTCFFNFVETINLNSVGRMGLRLVKILEFSKDGDSWKDRFPKTGFLLSTGHRIWKIEMPLKITYKLQMMRITTWEPVTISHLETIYFEVCEWTRAKNHKHTSPPPHDKPFIVSCSLIRRTGPKFSVDCDVCGFACMFKDIFVDWKASKFLRNFNPEWGWTVIACSSKKDTRVLVNESLKFVTSLSSHFISLSERPHLHT